jgi:fibronectin-binding autotransporter adhesin
MGRSFSHALPALACALLITFSSHAQTWDGGGLNNLWSNGLNWTGIPDNTAPVNNGTANVFFGGNVRLTPDMDAKWTINSLTFNNTASPFVLGSTGGFTLILEAGGIINNDNDLQTINTAVSVDASQSWTANSGQLSVGGNVFFRAGTVLTFTSVIGGNSTLSGAISGDGGLTKSGATLGGSLTLSGGSANSYTGATTVQGGVLVLSKPAGVDAIPAGQLIIGGVDKPTVSYSASDQINNGGVVTVNNLGTLSMNNFSDTIAQLSVNAGGAVNIAAGTLTIANAMQMTAGAVNSTGAGSLTLNGNLSTVAGPTAALITGNLNLGGGSRIVTVAAGGGPVDLDVQAVISNGGINKAGPGILRLAGNSFGGGLTVTDGTVAFASNTAAGAGTLTLAGGALQSDTVARTLSNPVTVNGDFAITGGKDLTLTGPATMNGNPTVTIATTATFSGQWSGAGALTKAGPGTLTLSGPISNGFGALIVNDGTVLLNKTPGLNAIGGNLLVNSGATVRLAANEQIANNQTPFVSGTGLLDLNGNQETIGGFNYTGGSVTTGTGTLTLNGPTLVNVSSTTATFTGNWSTGGFARDVTVNDGPAPIDFDFNGAIASGSINKKGGGTMRFTGGGTANINVNEGVLALGSDLALAGGGILNINGGAVQADGVARSVTNDASISTATSAVNGTQDLTFTGNLVIGGGAQLTVNNTGNTTFAGVVSGNGFIKRGFGTLIFSGPAANTFTGSLNLEQGTLILNKTPGVNAIPVFLSIGDGSGGPNADVVRLAAGNQIPDTATVTVAPSGLFDLNGFSETIGSLFIGGGSSITTGTGTLGLAGNVTGDGGVSPSSLFGNVDLTGGTRSFSISRGSQPVDLNIAATLSNGNFVKDGTGFVQLAGSSSNTHGSTTVNAGVLMLSKVSPAVAVPGALVVGDGVGGANADVARLFGPQETSASSPVTVNSSGLLDLNNFSNTIGSLVLNGGNVATGLGTLSFAPGFNPIASNASATTATISGSLSLGGVPRLITVADGAPAIDLDISAVIDFGGPNGSFGKDGPGTLRLSGANNLSNGTSLIAGTLAIGNNAALGTGPLTINNGVLQADGLARTLANTVIINGTGTVDGSQNLTINGGLTLLGASTLTKNGSGTLTIGPGINTLAGALNLNAGTLAFTNTAFVRSGASLTQNGGTFSGTLDNRGSFFFNGGAFNGTLVNEGFFTFTSDFNAANGFTNLGNLFVPGGPSLNANASGIDNEGSIQLAGGALQAGGTGPIVNNGQISGFGNLFGSAGFTNNAQISVSDGNLTIGNSGINLNAGNIDIPAGRQLRITAAALNNAGTISLAGGALGGISPVANNPGGTISGRGTISAPFANAGGTLLPQGGTINVLNPFNSSGLIRLQNGAGLAGGAITNTGRIQGDGSIANPITNNGRIEAVGTLAVGGALANPAAGTLSAATGSTLLVTSGLATNAGIISLGGGTFDNNGAPLNNTGQISGFGLFTTGGLTNDGSITLTGGFTTVAGPVTNNANRTIKVVNNPALWTGPVTNNGTFQVTNTTATFAGGNTGAGPSAALGGITQVEPGAAIVTSFLQQGTLDNGGTVTLRPKASGGQTTVVNNLTGSGALDLADNALIVDYTGPSPILSVRSALLAGSIMSSMLTPTTALGYTESADALGPNGGTFGGQSTDATAVLVKLTVFGDTNLDGIVNFVDLVHLAQNYSTPGEKTWGQGDFNYDGTVNFIDLVKLAQNYGTSLPSILPGAAPDFQNDSATAFADVPEPGALGFVVVCGLARLRPRRRLPSRSFHIL